MTALVWDQTGSRVFESGLDRGVLFLSDGSAVPWNGLISVDEIVDRVATPIYFDGKKVLDLVTLGDYAATLKAITYPDEFMEYEGLDEIGVGVYVGDQKPKLFSLSYRTRIGNDVGGQEVGYKIHIVYGLTAVPLNQVHETITEDPEMVRFGWKITAIPQEATGIRPTAHVIFDTRTVDPWLLEQIETSLYGTDVVDALLLPFADLVELSAYAVVITDNGNGTWTATTSRTGYITDDGTGDGVFEIQNVTATYLDADTYELSDTLA